MSVYIVLIYLVRLRPYHKGHRSWYVDKTNWSKAVFDVQKEDSVISRLGKIIKYVLLVEASLTPVASNVPSLSTANAVMA